MARPINADAEGTRRRILDSALRSFTERGSAASIRDIARGADVSLAMVHHYYGSKDELYAACVDEMYRELSGLRAALEAELSAEADVQALLERAVRRCFRFARAHHTAVRWLLRGVVSAGELDQQRQREVQRPFLSEISELLGAAMGRPGEELRLPLQSVVALVARYAISSDRELSVILGRERVRRADAEQRVEDHLVDVTRALVAPGAEEQRTCKRQA